MLSIRTGLLLLFGKSYGVDCITMTEIMFMFTQVCVCQYVRKTSITFINTTLSHCFFSIAFSNVDLQAVGAQNQPYRHFQPENRA